jgi:hypothetical protein
VFEHPVGDDGVNAPVCERQATVGEHVRFIEERVRKYDGIHVDPDHTAVGATEVKEPTAVLDRVLCAPLATTGSEVKNDSMRGDEAMDSGEELYCPVVAGEPPGYKLGYFADLHGVVGDTVRMA